MSFKTTLLIIVKIWSNIIYEEKIKRLKINYRNTSEVFENVTVFNLIASNRERGLHLDSKQSRLHVKYLSEILMWWEVVSQEEPSFWSVYKVSDK